jgi:tetratricopeptide (TPR) repeat protein
MLCKENAVVIPGLAVILILMVKPGDLTSRLRRCLPVLWLLLPLAIYLFMRANALAPPDLVDVTQGAGATTVPVMLHKVMVAPDLVDVTQEVGATTVAVMLHKVRLPGFAALLDVSAIFGTALKVVMWPHPLQLMYGGLSTTASSLYIGLNLGLVFAALVQVRRRRYAFAAGLAFFYLAMLPASRIISFGGDSHPHFAERYAYVPSIGLAILLAFALRALLQRLSPRAVARIALPVLLVLTALTWARNTDWRSEASLFGIDYKRGLRGEPTLRWMTSSHLKAGNFAWVVKICDDNLAQQEQYGDSAYVQSCARAYEHQRRFEDAERAHLYAIGHEKTRVAASMSLAHFYLRHARPLDAEQRFTAAIDWSDDPAEKALNTAEMIIALNPNSREQAIIARGYIEDALQHRPGWTKAESMLKVVDKALNPAPTPQIPESPGGKGKGPV